MKRLETREKTFREDIRLVILVDQVYNIQTILHELGVVKTFNTYTSCTSKKRVKHAILEDQKFVNLKISKIKHTLSRYCEQNKI